jgi:hypothetical protein
MAHSIIHRMMSDDSKIGTHFRFEVVDFRQTIYESLSRVRNRSNGSSELLFGDGDEIHQWNSQTI